MSAAMLATPHGVHSVCSLTLRGAEESEMLDGPGTTARRVCNRTRGSMRASAGALTARPRLRLVMTMTMMVSIFSLLLGKAEASKVVLPPPPPPPSSPAPATGLTAPAGGVRTGVLIHGCHLGARQWRAIMWGDERQQRLGRLPHGARLAWEENACVVVLGTGASEKGGVLEGRYALEYLTRNWESLREFSQAFSGVDLEEMRRAVQPLLVAEVRSQNTREELLEAGCIFRKENCNRIILVSSPTHLPRCLRDACSLWLEPPPPVDPHTTGANAPAREVATGTSSAGDGTYGSDSNYPQPRDGVQVLASRTREEEDADREAAEEMLEARQGDESTLRRRLEQPLDESTPRRRFGKPLSTGKVLAKNREVFSSAVSARQDDGEGEEGEGEKGEDKEEEWRRQWRPVVLASPSGTSYADYGPDDVVIVEPPHRGDDEGSVDRNEALSDLGELSPKSPDGSPEEVVPDEDVAQRGEDPLLLHELVALALRVKKSDRQFRRELEALLGRRLKEE